MTHEDYKELLAAHALTTLDPIDSRALAAHLEGCAACRQEQGEWEQTASSLVFAARSLEPAPPVRERLLERVRAESRPSDQVGAGAGRGLKPEAEVSLVVPFDRQRRRNLWSSLATPGALAATLVFVALIISLLGLWQQNRATQKESARLSTEIERTTAQLNQERAVIQLLISPDAHMSKLAGTGAAPGAQAMLAYDKNGHAMLMASGLPAAPNGMAYQLWFIVGSKSMPGKVFKTGPSGEGMLTDEVPAEALTAAVFAVTLEPEAGVESPTGATYLQSASS
jgi:Anti-sigma-K factor rskA, C-terminal/Putative zinc-finger